MPRRAYELPPFAEWDFSQVPPSEVYQCCIYEYARETVWFKDVVQVWRAAFCQSQPILNASALLGDSLRFGRTIKLALKSQPQAVARIIEPGSRGLAQGGAMLLRAFPHTPWQELQPEEKIFAARFVKTGVKRHFSEAYFQLLFDVQTGFLAACQGEAALRARMNDDLDLYVFQIEPDSTRNQVELAFKHWLQNTDRFSGRGADARTTIERSTPKFRLKHLAVSRLLAGGVSFTERIVVRTAREQCRIPGWLPERPSEWHAFQESAKAYRDRLFPPERGG